MENFSSETFFWDRLFSSLRSVAMTYQNLLGFVDITTGPFYIFYDMSLLEIDKYLDKKKCLVDFSTFINILEVSLDFIMTH